MANFYSDPAGLDHTDYVQAIEVSLGTRPRFVRILELLPGSQERGSLYSPRSSGRYLSRGNIDTVGPFQMLLFWEIMMILVSLPDQIIFDIIGDIALVTWF